jgi:hypothetical protein
VTTQREEHPQKQEGSIVLTEEGMQIDTSDEQSRKTPSVMRESVEPGSNATLERERQHMKQLYPIVSTVEGMQIDASDEQCANTESPRNGSLEPDSNTGTVVETKQLAHMGYRKILSTEEGMQVNTRL